MASQSALRILYEYDKNGVRPVSRMRVAMMVPDPVTSAPRTDQAGLWCELHDRQGKVLYHRILHHALGHNAEVFSKDPGEPMFRTPVADAAGAFEVIVPDIPEGYAVALVGPHHSSGKLRQGAIRYELDNIPETTGRNTP